MRIKIGFIRRRRKKRVKRRTPSRPIDRSYIIPEHEEKVAELFSIACRVLDLDGFKVRPLRRRSQPGAALRSYKLGYIQLEKKMVTLELYTHKTRRPRGYGALLKTIAHELAHYQKPPFKQLHKGRWINRIHYPEFYQQVTENINLFKQHPLLQPHLKTRSTLIHYLFGSVRDCLSVWVCFLFYRYQG